MNVFHSLKWIRGIVMELAGVGLIIWLAAGLPGVPGGAARPTALEAPRRAAAGSVEAGPASRLGWPWNGDWQTPPAAANAAPAAPTVSEARLRATDDRVAYTQARLEPAGRALRSLVEDTVASVLRDLTAAGTNRGTEAGSPPADWLP